MAQAGGLLVIVVEGVLEMTILIKPLLVALRPGTGTPPTSQGSG